MGNNPSVVEDPNAPLPPGAPLAPQERNPFAEVFDYRPGPGTQPRPGSHYVQPEGSMLGGVGIVFTQSPLGEYVVHMMLKGGPAHRSGRVAKGDKLVSINGSSPSPSNPRELRS